ncbi:MAG TPA: DUF6770 family protein [Pseudobacter sp.]|nr:DUF6770 family protein [Pseudobacter sp.]
MKRTIQTITALLLIHTAFAQGKLSIENVKTVFVRSTGPITTNNEVKGYFTFFQSDKVDKKNNEYTLQIMDDNLNKVKDVQFVDSKNITLQESAFDNNSLLFKFYNQDEKTYDCRVYGVDGKLKFNYERAVDKKTLDFLKATKMPPGSESNNLFAVEDKGFIAVYPQLMDDIPTFEVNFYSSREKRQWSYVPPVVKPAGGSFLGCSDNVAMFLVLKQAGTLLTPKLETWILGIYLQNGQRAFEIRTDAQQYNLMPMSVIKLKGTDNFMLLGAYFEKEEKNMGGRSLGVGLWLMNSSGRVMNTKYNSWETEISKVLNVNEKGNVENLGYVFFHDLIETEDGHFFAVCEGYKRTGNAVGIATIGVGGGMSKMIVTDMLLLHFDQKFNIKEAKIFEKNSNTLELPAGMMMLNLAAAGNYIKYGAYGFDYAFTQMDQSRSSFTVGYTDYVKDRDYKGLTFNAISYNNGSLSTDKINLKTEAGNMRIFAAKPGSVMIMEYFKKDKKLNMRLEKIN